MKPTRNAPSRDIDHNLGTLVALVAKARTTPHLLTDAERAEAYNAAIGAALWVGKHISKKLVPHEKPASKPLTRPLTKAEIRVMKAAPHDAPRVFVNTDLTVARRLFVRGLMERKPDTNTVFRCTTHGQEILDAQAPKND